jgi:hypothetical protein
LSIISFACRKDDSSMEMPPFSPDYGRALDITATQS